MELWLIGLFYVLALAALYYSYFYSRPKDMFVALIGSVLLILSGVILFTEGYDSPVVQCTGNICKEKTNILYDVNGNVSSIEPSIQRYNNVNSAAIRFISAVSYLIGFIAAIYPIGLKIREVAS